MKKIFILLTGVFLYTAAANGQAIKTAVASTQHSTVVSNKTKQQFANDFLNSPATKWEKSGVYDKATFLRDGETANAYYSADSKLVGTIIDKKISELPVVAQNYITDNYGDYSIESVALYDDNEANHSNIILYSQAFDNWDNYFVKLKKGGKELMLKISMDGKVSLFKKK